MTTESSKRVAYRNSLGGLALLVLLSTPAARGGQADRDAPSVASMERIIERHAADRGALERRYAVSFSPDRRERLRRFLEEEERGLQEVAFEGLDHSGRIDYLLLRNRLLADRRELARGEERWKEVAPLLPYARAVERLEDGRRRVEAVDGEKSAAALTEIAAQVDEARRELGRLEEAAKSSPGASGEGGKALPGKVAARRAAGQVDEIRQTLRRWYGFYAGYDPAFTWWAEQPYQAADKRLQEHAAFLRRLAGHVEGQEEPLIGDPIGRQALLEALEAEMIPYSPEELLEHAARGFEWCEAEYRRAAQELGFGDDWRKALEHVKGLHVKPGEQPRLIKDLAEEAIRFVEERDLVTVPPLCKETWRMEMMPPERQLVNPYFTGGEVISVSFPTDSMNFEDRLMSLRGNNIAFCRATVHHELIPGHHLQSFMAARHRPHRRLFRSPFLVEGWPLYWEMLLWDLGFPRTPADRVGMLFWRSHRYARIVFSLKFHLGNMTAPEAVDYLVERVGHERRNAAAEVRRSVQGDYPPLYQAAYMLGGLQLRAMRAELVESGRMKEREFHDAVLEENAIPLPLIRASLLRQPLSRDSSPRWRFLEGPERTAAAPARTALAAGGAAAREVRPRGRGDRPGVAGERLEPHWFPGGSRFWYRAERPAGRREFLVVDAAGGTRGPAFDHSRLAMALGKALGEAVEPDRLPLESLRFAEDGKSIRFRAGGRTWSADVESGAVAPSAEPLPAEPRDEEGAPGQRRRRGRRDGSSNVSGPGRGGPPARSPDGRWEVFVRAHNLYLRDLATGAEEPLSSDGKENDSYARNTARERAVELDYNRPDPDAALPDVRWSPDSRRLVALRTRPGTDRRVYLIESSPSDQLQPKLDSYPYLKPGDEVPVRKPRLFDIEEKREVPLDASLFSNPWSLGDLRWSRDSSRFTFLYNQRGHQVLRMVAVNGRSGEARALVDERSETFIDYSGKFFSESLDATEELIWMSERDGWNHLYLYDARAGRLKAQITRGPWVVRGVDRVDPEARQIWFQAGGIDPGQDPYHLHYCRVNFDGSGLLPLTAGDGTHSVQHSPDRRFFIDTWSRVDQPPVHELRRAGDGALILELERADASELLSTGWRPPERFVAKGRDGVTDIHGVIHLPPDLDPARKYPVIESIYAGPQGSFVPRSFRASYGQEELTALGFVVVQMDGMGTSHRSKKFHDVAWKNLGDAGFPDRILWIQAAARRHPYLDLSRVGIYGGSAGGQNALRAVLAHGDFYKAAAADCGCHDNRMDKIWWNEQWMGWPVGPHYAEQSNVTQAHRLEGKLLLTVGELDRNVDPASTMQVVNALIKADKDFELLVVPGAGHGAGSSRYGRRRRNDFFVRHLLGGAAPPVPAVALPAAVRVPEEEPAGRRGRL